MKGQQLNMPSRKFGDGAAKVSYSFAKVICLAYLP